MEEIQGLARARGGSRENRAPVTWVGFEVTIEPGTQDPIHVRNIGTAYDGRLEVLFDFGWRPHAKEHEEVGGLFFC